MVVVNQINSVKEKYVTPKYTLRISTFGCNLKCVYCRKESFSQVEPLSDLELMEVIKASVENGIDRIRWTGGEPTINPNFLKLVKNAQELGIHQQMLSTNGTLLHKCAKQLKDAGIYRVNISLDTLDRELYIKTTGYDYLNDVLESIKVSTNIFELVKINCVLMHDNLEKVPELINFTEKINNNKSQLILRFIELVKGGFDGDSTFVSNQHVFHKNLLDLVEKKYGISKSINIDGDNPMCYYYKLNNGVILGFVPNFSTQYMCGGIKCKKIRVNPTGFISNCSIYQDLGYNIKGLSYEEKKKIIYNLIEQKKAFTQEDYDKRKHYQMDYQFWRFGQESEMKK